MQCLEHEPFNRLRNLALLGLQRGRRVVSNRVRDGFRVPTLERRLAGQHLVQHDSDRPDIATNVGVLATRLLRRHVGHRTDCRARDCQLQRVRELGEAEVENLDAVLGEKQVARLDVTVHHALRMRFGQSFGHLTGNLESFVQGQGAGLQPLLERLAFVMRHDDEQLAVGGRFDIVNRADVGMVGGRGGCASRMNRCLAVSS